MPKRHRPYPPEFRRRIVELAHKGWTPEELGRQFEPSPQRIRNWARCLGVPIVPLVRFGRVVGSRKGYGRTIARTWPVILFLFLIQAVGFVAGAGDSPRRVQ